MICLDNPFKFFDKIYCINLKEETARWDECVKESEKYNLGIERFDAIKPTHLPTDQENGRLGIAKSHCEIIKKSISEGLDSVLILEDDFFFLQEPDYVYEKVKKCINELPEDWDCICLGANIINDYFPNPIEAYSANLLKLNSSYALHAIAFSKRGLLKFSNYFKSVETMGDEIAARYEAIDIFCAQVFFVSSKSFICNELLISQRDGFSSIEKRLVSYTFDLVKRLQDYQLIL